MGSKSSSLNNVPRDYIAVVYYNIEIYDSSPGRMDARGTKISP